MLTFINARLKQGEKSGDRVTIGRTFELVFSLTI
jgi:hypothetical protein